MTSYTTSARPVLSDEQMHSGILGVDKPTGVTSHDVVDHVRRRLRVKRAGHLGTLDPGASGLLLVAIGAATRCAQAFQRGEKTYEGAVRFGVVTSTQDLQGEILERRRVAVDEAAIRDATRFFIGDLDQIPPMVSAIKLGGERLYRLARRGQVVERPARRVQVQEWKWLGFDLPAATFRVRCSSGTYVRTLVHDLGVRLGTGGALESLRRFRSEPFGLDRAVTLTDLDTHAREEIWARAVIPLGEALAPLPTVSLDAHGATAIGYGSTAVVDPREVGGAPVIPKVGARAAAELPPLPDAGPETHLAAGTHLRRSVVFLGPTGEILALGELRPDPASERLIAHPHLVFPWAVRVGRL